MSVEHFSLDCMKYIIDGDMNYENNYANITKRTDA